MQTKQEKKLVGSITSRIFMFLKSPQEKPSLLEYSSRTFKCLYLVKPPAFLTLYNYVVNVYVKFKFPAFWDYINRQIFDSLAPQAKPTTAFNPFEGAQIAIATRPLRSATAFKSQTIAVSDYMGNNHRTRKI